jgi:hypothetical protein
MQGIEGEAAPQMDLAMKPRANIISYDEIVASTYNFSLDDSNTLTRVEDLKDHDEDNEDEAHKKFLSAINNLEESKKKERLDERGVVM